MLAGDALRARTLTLQIRSVRELVVYAVTDAHDF
jgi:hypothetical protein